jgi:hypothetical protein
MHQRTIFKMAVAISAIIGSAAGSGSLAAHAATASTRGTGFPAAITSLQPAPVTAGRPLIYLGAAGNAARLAGALNAGTISPQAASAAGIRIIICYVNFTHGRYNTTTVSDIRWAAGVGCTARIILDGRAYLLKGARTYVQVGQYIGPGARRSYSSGGHITEPGHPKVFIFHGLNMKLLPSQEENTIVGVLPQPGTPIDRSLSHCHVTNWTVNGPIGAHCDLYSPRF